MLNKLVAATAVAIMVIGNSAAFALTIKSGEVLTTDANGNSVAVPAYETETGQNQINNQGYVIAGGQIHIGVGDEVVSIDLSDLRGKSKDEIKEIIGEAIYDQLGDDDISTTHVGDAVIVDADDFDSAVEEAVNNGGSFAVIADEISEEASDAIADEVNEALPINWDEIDEGTNHVEINGVIHERT